VNLDPRAWPDVHRLLYELEHGGQTMEREEPFQKNAEFTKLAGKYAPHLAIYLYRKVKIIMRAFLTDMWNSI